MKESERKKIITFMAKHDWSFQLIGDHFGITRNQVAGIMFRHRHPLSTRVNSPNGHKNKLGTGYRGFTGEYPARTVLSAR